MRNITKENQAMFYVLLIATILGLGVTLATILTAILVGMRSLTLYIAAFSQKKPYHHGGPSAFGV
jgi:uncharacterized membrane protein YczE